MKTYEEFRLALLMCDTWESGRMVLMERDLEWQARVAAAVPAPMCPECKKQESVRDQMTALRALSRDS